MHRLARDDGKARTGPTIGVRESDPRDTRIARHHLVLLETIFRHCPDPIALLDRDFNFIRLSESFARADRRDISAFEGQGFFDLYPSEYRAEAERVRETKRAGHWTERPFRHPEHPEWGETYWDVGFIPVLDSQGEVRMFLLTLKDATARVWTAESLHDRASHIRRLSRRLREVEERERRAIARELHDRLGQSLSTMNIEIGMLAHVLADGGVEMIEERLRETRRTLQEAIRGVRDLMNQLRPPALERFGLFAALQDLAADFSRKLGMTVQLEGRPADWRTTALREISLYRIAQEALCNVARHAHARNVILRFHADAEAIGLAIEDDGRGFDPGLAGNSAKTWGLVNMRERAEEAGIAIDIRSTPGKGTTIALRAERDAP